MSSEQAYVDHFNLIDQTDSQNPVTFFFLVFIQVFFSDIFLSVSFVF